MKRARFLSLLIAALALATPASSFAQKGRKAAAHGEKRGKKDKKDKKDEAAPIGGKIKLRVVDVAGGRAYVEPGAKAGLRTGDTIVFERREYSVVAVSPSTAAVELGKYPLRVDDVGTTTIDPNRAPQRVELLAKPDPLASFRGTWPDSVVPATGQHPKRIPLGPVTRPERSSFALGLAANAVVPTSGSTSSFVHTELRGILHYEPFVEMPLGLDADIGLQNWFGRDLAPESSDSRPLVRIRALQAAYGNEGAFLAALGRMRYASSTVGPLDGLRVRAPIVGGVWLGAFGGLIANPLTDLPASQASRFGAELGWEDPMADWRPRVVLGGHASRFGGALDERRLDALFDLNPESGRFGAFAEASFFDKGNPWNADTTELSAAGADAAVRAGPVELGGRFAMQRPERSRYLATFLPPEWLCIQRTTATPPGACFGSEATYVGTADAGLHFEKVTTTFGGTYSRTAHTNAEQLGGFGNLRLLDLIGRMRLDTGFMGSRGTLLQTAAVSVSPGIVVLDGAADVSLRYRPAILRYGASTAPFVEHSVGGALWLSPSASFDLTLDADYVTGGDFDALLMQTAMVWRTGF
jgi:hypothetical protein